MASGSIPTTHLVELDYSPSGDISEPGVSSISLSNDAAILTIEVHTAQLQPQKMEIKGKTCMPQESSLSMHNGIIRNANDGGCVTQASLFCLASPFMKMEGL